MPDSTIFAIQAGALRAAVTRAGRAAYRRNTIPILAHLHLAATAGLLRVQATDLECHLTVEARGTGDLLPITADAARLAALLAHLPEEETVTLSQAPEGQLVVQAGPVRARLFSQPPEDFPAAHETAWTARWAIPATDLLALIDRTRHAISVEETRYYLNGIYLETEQSEAGPRLRATATDGHRLMIAEAAWPSGDAPIAAILPRDMLNRLRPLLAQLSPDRVVEVRQTDVLVEFSAGGWRLWSKVIDGTFPDYRRVIPSDEGELLQVLNSRRMAEAIRTVSAIGTARSKPIRFSNGSGSTVTLHCRDPEEGEAELTLDPEIALWRSNGRHPEFGAQARYLLDLLAVLRGPEGVALRVKDGSGPILATGAEGTAALMPMRV